MDGISMSRSFTDVRKRSNCLRVLVCVGALVQSPPGSAFQLSPEGTAQERQLSDASRSWTSRLEQLLVDFGLSHFADPIHEELTNRIYGCDGGASECARMDASNAPPAVLAGVRWNDDPPFRLAAGQAKGTSCKTTQTIRLRTQPRCWMELFRDAQRRSVEGGIDKNDTDLGMIYRSHFGDLQFLHAMANRDGEPAKVTQDSLLGWTEFTWRVAIGEISGDALLRDVNVLSMTEHFGTSGWRVVDLFALGSPGLKLQIEEIAFGSLLHALEDSFAEGHVQRATALSKAVCKAGSREISAPGEIVEFHSYVHQNADAHKESDSRLAMVSHLQEDADVISIGREMRRMVSDKALWDEVRPLMECVYKISDSQNLSSPGAAYRKI